VRRWLSGQLESFTIIVRDDVVHLVVPLEVWGIESSLRHQLKTYWNMRLFVHLDEVGLHLATWLNKYYEDERAYEAFVGQALPRLQLGDG
jgi:hypothetical protein